MLCSYSKRGITSTRRWDTIYSPAKTNRFYVFGRANVKTFFEAGSPEQGCPDLRMVNYLDTQFDLRFPIRPAILTPFLALAMLE
jgi:hypothetical protein